MEREQDFMIRMNHPIAGQIRVSPTVDVIKRYNPDKEEYDHLQYVDDEKSKITFLFLGRAALDALANAGVTEAYHDDVYESIGQHYDDWQELVREKTAPPEPTPDEIVAREAAKLDQEWDYWDKEWNNGNDGA